MVCLHPGAQPLVQGSIDEVNTWERALGSAEADLIYQSQPKPVPTLAITGLTVPGEGQLQFTVATSYGPADYRLQSSADLKAGSWSDETTATIAPASMGAFTIDLFTPITGRRYYRVYLP